MKVDKLVLTGPAHSGKTSVIEEISKRGYAIINETALEIISLGVNLWGDIKTWQEWRKVLDNEKQFQTSVAIMQATKESLIQHQMKQPIFLDRGILDGLAYSKLRNIDASELIKGFQINYSLAFLFESLPFEARIESGRIDTEVENKKVQEIIREIYNDFKIEIIDVPNFHSNKIKNIIQRADFIINTANERIKNTNKLTLDNDFLRT